MKEEQINEIIDDIIGDLDAYGRNYDGYEYGLPSYDEHLEAMRDIVKRGFNKLTLEMKAEKLSIDEQGNPNGDVIKWMVEQNQRQMK